MLRGIAILGMASFGFGPLPAQQKPDLAATLTRIDAASQKFTSAQADVEKDLYNALIKETDKQNGKAYFLRDRKGGSTQMGLIAYGPSGKLSGPGSRLVEYKSGTLRDYNPSLKCFDSVRSGKIETFLTLGFGGSGQDLNKAWTITDLGPDTVAGVKAEKLDLVPRDPGVKSNVLHVVLWLDLDRDVSLQQVFYSPTGDTQTARYTNIRLNGKVELKPFEIKGNACGK